MPYCTEEQFIARFGAQELDQLLGRGTHSPSAVTSGRQYAAIAADADAVIDSALTQRDISLPLPSVPPRVLELAADITRYKLYDDARGLTEDTAVVVRHRQAIEFLAAFAEGRGAIAGLPQSSDGAVVPLALAAVRVSRVDRVFDSQSLASY